MNPTEEMITAFLDAWDNDWRTHNLTRRECCAAGLRAYEEVKAKTESDSSQAKPGSGEQKTVPDAPAHWGGLKLPRVGP